jgi:hypothetical protein
MARTDLLSKHLHLLCLLVKYVLRKKKAVYISSKIHCMYYVEIPGFNPRSRLVGSVVGKVTMSQISSRKLGLPCQSSFHQHSFDIYFSSRHRCYSLNTGLTKYLNKCVSSVQVYIFHFSPTDTTQICPSYPSSWYDNRNNEVKCRNMKNIMQFSLLS